MAPPRRLSRRGGVSVVEILIATVIFITAFLALLGVFPAALQSIQQARELNLATFLAEQRLEQIRAVATSSATNFAALQSDTSPTAVPVSITTNGHESIVNYSTQALVAPSPAASPSMKQVQVTVSWMSRRNTGTDSDLKTVRLATEILAP